MVHTNYDNIDELKIAHYCPTTIVNSPYMQDINKK